MIDLDALERAAHDDAFALKCGEALTTIMERAAKRTPRGKPKQPRSA